MAKPELNNDMPFTATNYRLLLIGMAILVVGYILMAGGGNGGPTRSMRVNSSVYGGSPWRRSWCW